MRYQLLQQLSLSECGSTSLALDTQSGDSVVVHRFSLANRFAPHFDAEKIFQEALALRSLSESSSFRADIFNVDKDHEQVSVVSRFLPGTSLSALIRERTLSVEDVLHLATQLAHSLREIRLRGLPPRLPSPRQLIANENGGRLTFALVDYLTPPHPRLAPHDFNGTPPHTSFLPPEFFASYFGELGAASEIYTIAALVHFALTGSPPFEGHSRDDVVRKICYVKSPRLRKEGVLVPRSLEEVLFRALKKYSADRYQCFDSFLHDLCLIEKELQNGSTEPSVIIGQTDLRSTLTDPAFVPPQEELLAWNVHLGHLRRGLGGVVFLEAESGGGKTRLLEEFEIKARQSGLRIMSGQGLDRSAQKPFQMLSGVATKILTFDIDEPVAARRLRERLEFHKEALSTALPELRPFFNVAPSTLGPENFGEIRSLNSLCALLDCLGTEEVPSVIFLDDCQWADELTIRFLHYWALHLSKRNDAKRFVTIVASFRSEEVGELHPLRQIGPSLHIRLRALTLEQMTSLALSIAGQTEPSIIEKAALISEGSPFMFTAVLRGMAESHVISFMEGQGWKVSQQTKADLCLPTRAMTLLETRIKLLPSEIFHVLSLAAVIGKEFSLQELSGILNITMSTLLPLIDEAERRNIVVSEANERASFVHDKIRETTLFLNSEESLKSLHSRTAQFLRLHSSQEFFRIAFHYDSAQEFEAAMPFALKGALRARAQHSLELAEQLFKIAARGVPPNDTATQLAVTEGLGDTLMLRGRYVAAAQAFERAMGLLSDTTEKARLKQKMGELAFKKGDIDVSITHLSESLSLLGRYVPSSKIAYVAFATWEVMIQALHSIFAKLFLSRRPSSSRTEAQILALQSFTRIAYAYWFGRGKIECAWAHLRGMNFSERFSESPELAQSYSEHAPVMTMVPYYSRGIRYAQKSFLIRERLGDVWGQGQSLSFFGVVLYGASQFERAIEQFSRAMTLLEQTGDRWEVNTARWHSGFCYFRLGELSKAAAICERVFQDGLEIRDFHAMCITQWCWAAATRGKVDRSFLSSALADERGDPFTRVMLLQTQALCLLFDDKPQEASALLESTAAIVTKKALLQDYCLAVWTTLCTSLRNEIESEGTEQSARRRRLLKKAKRVARKSLAVARKYKNHLPQSLRENGLIATLAGNPRRGLTYLNESLEVATAQKARYEYALTLRAIADVKEHLGISDFDETRRKANAQLAEIEI